jgi:hypothetical protein
MRWLNSEAFGRRRFLLLHQFLLFWVILCFLVTFSPGLADTLIDPNNPGWEHPWDDLEHQNPDGSGGGNPPDVEHVMVLQLGGFNLWVIIQQPSAPNQSSSGEKEVSGRAEGSHGRVLMLFR